MRSLVTFLSDLILRFLTIALPDVIKKMLSYVHLRLYRRLKQGRLDFYQFALKGKPEKVGFISHPVEWELETPQSELHLAGADDEIFFYSVNSKKEYLIVSISRLCNHKAEAIIYLKLANGKTYKLERNLDFQQSTGDERTFSCGGLQMYTSRPMKRWRIFYSGYLKDISEETLEVQGMVYVKFSFLWRASSDVYDSTSDMDDSLIVESVSKADWRYVVPPVQKLFDATDFYAQAGAIFGTVCIDGVLEDYEMYLFGEKIRFLENVLISKAMDFIHTLGFIHENGMFLHFGEASATNIAEKLNYGFIVKPDGDLKKLKKIKLSIKNEIDSAETQKISAKIEAGQTYNLCGSVMQRVAQMSNGNNACNIYQVKFYVNGKKGSGIQIKRKIQVSSDRKISDINLPVKIPECIHPMVTAFNEDLCRLPEITGGKGSSLGKLTTLSDELQSFYVPNGFVVTTSSYKHFANEDILDEIKHLEDVLYRNTAGDVKEVCKRVQDKITATDIPHPVIDNIVRNLQKIFGYDYKTKKFAVRSSAMGEDTEQMSAAGQMETYLGVTGLRQVLSAVKKCWASQFGFIAVQYKRRYGQCLNSPMAVVIQEMVACDKAGVMFTCDPVSGKSNRMSIAANFGLGESVVSSAAEPDTIELIRYEDDELRTNTVMVGSKKQKTVLSNAGTRPEYVPESEKQRCCLSINEILRLGDLGLKIEKNFRSKRDIEWGMKNDRIYIFQSRPVTSGTQETEFEIEHEFDSSLRVENDYFSVANAAEVLPGAIPPLSLDVFLNLHHITERGNYEVETSTDVKTRYFLMGWLTMYSHLMFNIPDVFHKSHRQKKTLAKSIMASSFGMTLDDEELFKVTEQRYSDDKQNASLKTLLKIAKCMLLAGKRLKEGKKFYKSYRIPVEKYHTSKELFKALLDHCCDLSFAFLVHVYCSSRSAIGNMLIFLALSQDKEDLDNDMYTDFARLITMGGNAESSDVPTSIQDLAFHISKSTDAEKFKAMKTEEALEWLTDTSTPVGMKFTEFMEKHGHRGFREIDIYSPSWRSDPKPLIQLLQSKVGSVSEEAPKRKDSSLLNLINHLHTPTGLLTKLKLMLLAPLCWKGVQGREGSKSLLVKGLDAWRAAYWHLAELMVSEGRIPEQKMLFFMTLEEVKELLDSRSPKILARAYRRQNLFPKMNDYLFPEIMRGLPRPINTSDEENGTFEDESLSMKGVPVSQGIARGYVRVAITIHEAADLKPGEILLTCGTDVGWSPYFPSLAGVATELGGLISHGAVISREYGLPCVSGLRGATRRFRTGDYVLLDGNKGVLKKIPEPE